MVFVRFRKYKAIFEGITLEQSDTCAERVILKILSKSKFLEVCFENAPTRMLVPISEIDMDETYGSCCDVRVVTKSRLEYMLRFQEHGNATIFMRILELHGRDCPELIEQLGIPPPDYVSDSDEDSTADDTTVKCESLADDNSLDGRSTSDSDVANNDKDLEELEDIYWDCSDQMDTTYEQDTINEPQAANDQEQQQQDVEYHDPEVHIEDPHFLGNINDDIVRLEATIGELELSIDGYIAMIQDYCNIAGGYDPTDCPGSLGSDSELDY